LGASKQGSSGDQKSALASFAMGATDLLIYVIARTCFKFLLTPGRTKIISSSFMLGLSGGFRFLDLHPANRILMCRHISSFL
jgi:hypothetical protein